MLESKALCRTTSADIFWPEVTSGTAAHALQQQSRTWPSPPPESKDCDFLSFFLSVHEVTGGMCRVSHPEGRKWREKREGRLWHLKSMCHCNVRRDSLPCTPPRREKKGAIDGRSEEEELHQPESELLLIKEMLASVSLQFYFGVSLSSSHCLPTTPVTLCGPRTLLDMPYTLCRSAVKCLLWLWRLYLQSDVS